MEKVLTRHIEEFVQSDEHKRLIVKAMKSLKCKHKFSSFDFVDFTKSMDVGIEFIKEESIFPIIRGRIGSSLGAQFYTFYNEYSNNVSVKDIEAFIKKTWKAQEKADTFDVLKLGEEVALFTDKMEGVVKLEHMNSIYEKYSSKFSEPRVTTHTVIPLFGLLYLSGIEILTSFLKDKKANDKENLYKMMKLDFDKNLARCIKSKIAKASAW